MTAKKLSFQTCPNLPQMANFILTLTLNSEECKVAHLLFYGKKCVSS